MLLIVGLSGCNSTQLSTEKSPPEISFAKQTTPTKGIKIVGTTPGLLWSEFNIIGGTLTPAATDV